jgi:tRNA(fMet)-specific endonuclease VapC
MCTIVKAELLFGARKSAKPERNLAALATFFTPFRCLPFDDAAADAYGLVRAELEQRGTPIGPNDLLIASIALSCGLRLVTSNAREFARVPGLAIEDWSA